MQAKRSSESWAWVRTLFGLAVGVALLAAGSWLLISGANMPDLNPRGATATVQTPAR